MRYLSFIFTVIYLLFAYLQLNDPDPILWVTLYLLPAFISFRAFLNQYSSETLILLTVLYSAYAINSFLQMTAFEGFSTEGQGLAMKTSNQELLREGSGLLICIVSFLTYLFYFSFKMRYSLIRSKEEITFSEDAEMQEI
ncbi:MAG TPA: transmembrane 220 family protein [Bacteroidia bacterium]|jgi:hypothetical protein